MKARSNRAENGRARERKRNGEIHKRGKIAHELGAIFNSRIPSVPRPGWLMSSLPVGKRRGGEGLKGKDEGDDGDGCTLRVADRTEKSGEMDEERERERGEGGGASFPLAACIIQKLAGLYTRVFCCTSKQIEMQTGAE